MTGSTGPSRSALADAIRDALDNPNRMAEIVTQLNRDLDPGDLAFIKSLLDFLDAAARMARSRHGDAPGTIARILHDAMHQIRWRVGHHYKTRAKIGIKGLGAGVLHEWVRYYAWMDETAFTRHIVGSARPLAKKDLHVLTSQQLLSRTATKLADHTHPVTLP